MLSIKLDDYINGLLGNTLDNYSIPKYVALQLLNEDKDERLIHVELLASGEYVVWRKSSWLISQRRETYRRTLSERERAVGVRRQELLTEFVRAFRKATGLEEEQARDTCAALIATRNPHAAAAFGIDLSELLAADAALRQFKEETRTR